MADWVFLTEGRPVSDILNEPRRSARKAKGDGHLRRAEILEAEERIFVVHGYEGATIRKIADEVGVSSTALYMHFRDKDQILLEICAGAMHELLECNSQIYVMPIDAVTRVREAFHGAVEPVPQGDRHLLIAEPRRHPYSTGTTGLPPSSSWCRYSQMP